MKEFHCRAACGKRFQSPHSENQHAIAKHGAADKPRRVKAFQGRSCGPSAMDAEPDYGGSCEVCGQSPVVPATGMCGPCTFGEAETAGGNW